MIHKHDLIFLWILLNEKKLSNNLVSKNPNFSQVQKATRESIWGEREEKVILYIHTLIREMRDGAQQLRTFALAPHWYCFTVTGLPTIEEDLEEKGKNNELMEECQEWPIIVKKAVFLGGLKIKLRLRYTTVPTSHQVV